jgi:hypothetical protein
MYLDAASRTSEVEEGVFGAAVGARCEVFDPWADWPPSEISHHGKFCCEAAREWLNATDFTALNGGSILTGPRWIRHRFKWGPSAFPIYWCEAVRKKRLDCGALAALSHEVLSARGVRSFRAQFVQRFNGDATTQWSCGWSKEGVPVGWIKEDLIYHEGVAVAQNGPNIKVWDSSAGWWVDSTGPAGYGSVVAIRVFAPAKLRELLWGDRRLVPNRWQPCTTDQ